MTPFAYQLVRSKRKTLAIQVYPDGRVIVRAPLRAPADAIAAFVESRAAWVTAHQARFRERTVALPPPRRWVTGEHYPYLGRSLALRVAAAARVRVWATDDALIVRVPDPADSEAVAAAIDRWRRREAARVFDERLTACLPLVAWLGIERPPIAVRLMRSRWGSCGSNGRIRLNVRLLHAPLAVIDYVIVHELCHLREMNHSAAYYALLDRALPDWRPRRAALKTLDGV